MEQGPNMVYGLYGIKKEITGQGHATKSHNGQCAEAKIAVWLLGGGKGFRFDLCHYTISVQFAFLWQRGRPPFLWGKIFFCLKKNSRFGWHRQHSCAANGVLACIVHERAERKAALHTSTLTCLPAGKRCREGMMTRSKRCCRRG